MRVWGLTGGMAMGKSFAATIFRRAGVPVFDADAAVHALQARGGAAVAAIGQAFPGSVRGGAVDRAALRSMVLASPDRLRVLEAILHPMVRALTRRFLARQRRAGCPLVVLDIPLLLEAGRPAQVDVVVVVTAPAAIQRLRLRRRDRMSPAQIDAVLARQLPDAQRRAAADRLIRTGLSRHHAQARIRRLLAAERARPGRIGPGSLAE